MISYSHNKKIHPVATDFVTSLTGSLEDFLRRGASCICLVNEEGTGKTLERFQI